MSKPEAGTDTLGIRRQRARMNNACRICTKEKPVKGTDICKACTARRAKFTGRR